MEQNYYSRGRKKIGFFSFLRDVLISSLPLFAKRISGLLIPYRPDFIFLTHPRNEEDIYATFPFLGVIQKAAPNLAKMILASSPCYIVADVVAPGKKGYVISTVELPERLFSSREQTQKLIIGCINFFRKICIKRTYVGLAAWWPIVSNSGQAFSRQLTKGDHIEITNGHTATLASIYLSIQELCKIIGLPFDKSKILIIGAGKVGGALGELLSGKVKKIGLADKNKMRLKGLRKQLEEESRASELETILVEDLDAERMILRELQRYDLAVCTTSNTGLLISDANQLQNCIILDDSRPEAFPRTFSQERKVVVLEGGLMKIPGVSLDSDFGFGQDENIFGCLSEAIILALDGSKKIKPNVGELDLENLYNLIEFCKSSGIRVGDFKCAHRLVKEDELISIFDPLKQHV